MRRATIAWLSAAVCVAQVREFPERGMTPTGSYTISDIESISNTTGNLHLSIPLAQMPNGRAKGMAGIRLNYNSSLFNVTYEPSGYGPLNKTVANTSEEGGWTYSFGYGIRLVDRTPTTTVCENLPREALYPTKLVLLMPDGGTKELNRRGEADQHDGYHEWSVGGYKYQCPPPFQQTSGTFWYYTTDGSYLRLEIPVSSVPYINQTWTLHFPDGGKAQGKGENTTKITNANGWSVSFSGTYDLAATVRTGNVTISEDQPPSRSISLALGSPSAMVDTISWTGYNGAQLSTKVNWGNITASTVSYQCDTNQNAPECTLPPGRVVVNSITIPSGNVSDTAAYNYQFSYRDAATCGASGITICYGELGKIIMPAAQTDPITPPTDVFSVSYLYAREGLGLLLGSAGNLDGTVKRRSVTYKEHSSGDTSGSLQPAEVTCYRHNGTSFDISSDPNCLNLNGMINAVKTTHYFYDPRVMSDPKRGLVYKTVGPKGTVVEKLWWRNQTDSTADQDPGNPYVRVEATSVPNSSGVASRSAVKRFSIDTNGNPRSTEEYDWVNESQLSRTGGVLNEIQASATLARKTVWTYYNAAAEVDTGGTDGGAAADAATAYFHSSSVLVPNLRTIKRTETRNGLGAVAASAEFEFDNPSTTGNRTKEVRWDSSLDSVSNPLRQTDEAIPNTNPPQVLRKNVVITTTTYTCSGAPQVVTDPNGYTTTTTWDSNCQYPATQEQQIEGTAKRKTTFLHDASTGLQTEVKDFDNDSKTIFSYDRLGRRTLTREAADQTIERKTVITFDDVNRRVITKQDKLATGDGLLVSVQRYDARGVTWLTQEIEDGTTPSETDYTSGIRTERRSRISGLFSYEAVSSPYRASNDDTTGWTLTKRDVAGRVESTTSYSGSTAPSPFGANSSAMGTTGLAYDGEFTTTTAPGSVTITHGRDALGRITSANAGGLSSTTNGYDALDNLVSVTQVSQSRTFNYSSLSRLLSATQPENGTTTYTYDDGGNLLSRTDARGAATGKTAYLAPSSPSGAKAFDGLGRPRIMRVLEAGVGKDVTWTWDTATNGKGRLGSIAFGTTTVSYSAYDKLGRVTGHTQTTDGTAYPFSYTYFPNDEAKTIDYPSGRTVTYSLDGAGRNSTASAPGRDYVTGATYAPHGEIKQLNLSGGTLQQTRAFNGKLQIEEIKVQKVSPLTELVKLEYDYHVSAATENNGNPRVHRATHGGTTYTHTYGFDTANRLTSMVETPLAGSNGYAISQGYNYDSFNNMWVTSPMEPKTIAAIDYTPKAPEAFNTATNRFSSVMGDEYDDAGHTTVAELGAITSVWDSEGRRIKATYQSFKPTTFVFDGLGQRVKKANEDWGEYVYVFDAFGRLAAEYGPGINGECSVCYPFADAVGSTRMVADASGNAVQRFDFSGFGTGITTTWSWTNGRSGLWDDASAVKQQWGGHYRDDMPWEGGMEFFGARAYKRPYGRFLSPDENLVDQDPADPLSWNLFAYARNNPVRYTDPTGMACAVDKDGFNIDDGNGERCDLMKFATVHAKADPVPLADFDRSPMEFAFGVFGDVGRRTGSAAQWTGVLSGGGQEAASWMNGGGELKLGAAVGSWWLRRNLHHAIPMFMGGSRKQLLVKLPVWLHKRFHSALDSRLKAEGFPAASAGAATWDAFLTKNPERANRALEVLKEISLEFDKAHGTRLLDAVVENLKRGAFR